MKQQSIIKISLIIKALNEEKNIASTIQSAIDALQGFSSEIILADSYSTDRTVEIASQYSIRIVQITHPNERCCGVGGQLGYQYATGEFVWLIDGDMTIEKSFLAHALKFLDDHPKTAGVGGRVVERNLESLEFRSRVQRAPKDLLPGLVDRLDGGGVYRRTAIDGLGYFTNRNLHAYEEYELAVRLRSHDWELYRIDKVAVSHFGHQTEAYQLLLKRWQSGYVLGIGELLKSAIGQNYLKLLIKEVREIRVYAVVAIGWTALGIILAFGLIYKHAISSYILYFLITPFLGMIVKKKSISTGIYSVVSWHAYALGLIGGLLKKQTSPHLTISSIEINNKIN